MVQIADGNDRKIWAYNLGRLIFSMNEIDWILCRIRKDVFKKKLSNEWFKTTFSKRISILEENIKHSPASPAIDKLKHLIQRTKPLNDARNHVAHGMLTLVGAPKGSPRGASFMMIRYNKMEIHEMKFHMLVKQTEEAMQLSNDYSEFYAMCCFYEDFICPHPSG